MAIPINLKTLGREVRKTIKRPRPKKPTPPPELYRVKRRVSSFREVEDDPASVYNTLSEEEKQYVKNVVLRGLTIRDSIIDAYGMSDDKQITALERSLQRSPSVRSAIGEAMDAVEITDGFLAEVLKRGLNAEKIYYDKDQGVINTGEHDHATQHKFLETALKLKGAFDKPENPQGDESEDDDVRIKQRVKVETEMEELKKHLTVDA